MNDNSLNSSQIPVQTDYLNLAREEIDKVDAELRNLFTRRMNAVRVISIAKKFAGVPTDVPTREADILAKIQNEMPKNLQADAGYLFHTFFGISKQYQQDHPFETLTTRILLCGIKHCGKTTTAHMLSELLHVPCFDTDEIMATKLNCNLREYYANNGEIPFRAKEAEVLRSLDDTLPQSCVVALGGGALTNPFFPPYLLHHTGHIVWLNLPVETAYSRIVREGLPPFLQDTPDPQQTFESQCAERIRYYRAAAETTLNVTEDDTPFQVVGALLNSLPDKMFQSAED